MTDSVGLSARMLATGLPHCFLLGLRLKGVARPRPTPLGNKQGNNDSRPAQGTRNPGTARHAAQRSSPSGQLSVFGESLEVPGNARNPGFETITDRSRQPSLFKKLPPHSLCASFEKGSAQHKPSTTPPQFAAASMAKILSCNSAGPNSHRSSRHVALCRCSGDQT